MLAKEAMRPRSSPRAKMSTIAAVENRPTLPPRQTHRSSTAGNSRTVAIISVILAELYNEALMHEAAERSAVTETIVNPIDPKVGLAASARA